MFLCFMVQKVCDATSDPTWRVVMYGQWIGDEKLKEYSSVKQTLTCKPDPQPICLVEIFCSESNHRDTSIVVQAAFEKMISLLDE